MQKIGGDVPKANLVRETDEEKGAAAKKEDGRRGAKEGENEMEARMEGEDEEG